METDRKALARLRDSLWRVEANPSSAHCWHGLGRALRSVKDAESQKTALRELLARTPADGEAGFLRATLMVSLTNSAQYLAEAGRLARKIRPVSSDRLMAFLNFTWGRVLASSKGRDQFAELFLNAGIPALLALLARVLKHQAGEDLAARPMDAVRKVAVLAPHLSTLDHAPTSLALHHARMLAAQGFEVQVFAAQELALPEMKYFLGNGESSHIAPADRAAWQGLLPAGMPVHVADASFSPQMRWRNQWRRITAFDPDLIFLVGFFSPPVQALFPQRPVVGLSLHTTPPLAPVDVWLTADVDQAGQAVARWAPALPPCEGYYYPYRIVLKPTGPALIRQQLGLDASTLVFLTVGDRLTQEIEPTWGQKMVAFLRQHPQVQWLLVGGRGEVPAALRGQLPESQLRTLAHHADIRGICRCCDVFVNPPRMGGGFSVAQAMAEALPVAAYSGSDGGDKLGSLAAADDDAYFGLLADWIKAPSSRQEAGTRLQERFRSMLDLEQGGPALRAVCERALALFQKRVSSSAS